ncbi:MAG: ATP-binding protein [Flavobacteriaceae bacterium]
MKPKRIVITGGPGSGKTSLIDYLKEQGKACLPEVSREVTARAQAQGIDQLFLKDPILFSKLLLEGRLEQYAAAESLPSDFLFYDRGIPDILAYMDYLKTEYPSYFSEACVHNKYDVVFLLPPWEDIYIQDKERYESFQEAEKIFHYLHQGYQYFGYEVHHVPVGSIEYRCAHILKKIEELL